jgi:hypothetical protein
VHGNGQALRSLAGLIDLQEKATEVDARFPLQ